MRVNIYDQRLFGAGCELWGRCPISACCSSSNNYVVAPLLLWIKSKPSGQVNLALGSELILYMSSLLYTCHLPLASCCTCRSHRACANGMRRGEQLPPSLSLCRWHCRLPWEEFDECARYTAGRYNRTVSVARSLKMWSVFNMYSLTVPQSPGAELHYGAASEILLQFPALATHRSVQQQHLEDCTRCAKWPQAANNAVSRRALATSSTL